MTILAGDKLSESVKVRPSALASENLTNNQTYTVAWKRCKIACRPKLVLITNRKSYVSFPLVQKSMTLNGVMAVTLSYFTEFDKPVFQPRRSVHG